MMSCWLLPGFPMHVDRSAIVRRIPVLLYHHVNIHAGDTVTITPDVFAQQMKFLHDEGYHSLSADELYGFIRRKMPLRKRPVVITFDDGWLDNDLYAVPVLEKYRFKATFFLITARVDAASQGSWQQAAEIPVHEAAKTLIQRGEAGRVALSWGRVKELERSGLFRFFSHTVNHRRCAGLSSQDLFSELADSKERIETELGRGCDYLCWPYGSFSEETVKVATKIGYKGLFTTEDGFCEPGSSPDMIKRIEVTNSLESLKDRLFERSL
jgi:peptidoglycan/xylan/chitin deacetylase (PgdA/CDA1 family)